MASYNPVILKDSYYSDGYLSEDAIIPYNKAEKHREAVLQLQRLYEDNKIEIIHLGQYSHKEVDESPIGIKVRSIEGELNTVFTTSHYIGCFSNNGITFKIEPRFGNQPDVLNRMLSYACDVYVPQSETGSNESKDSNLWLIILLFRSLLKQAIAKGQIPKEYRTYTRNLRTFKGRLNVSKQIHYNLTDNSKFYCTYKKLTVDTLINRTIRYTYSLIRKKYPAMLTSLKGINEHDNKLASLGVDDEAIDVKDLSKIKYNKMTISYRPVIEICRAILLHTSIVSNNSATNDAPLSYFIDMADLWELYLLRVLQKGLPDYHVYSPNESEGEYLMENEYRETRPDIMIEKDGKLLMIIDAKYKNYRELGKTSNSEYHYVSREDMNQMGTYILNYSNGNQSLIGLFTSPAESNKENDFHYLRTNSQYSIGLLNMSIGSLENDTNNSGKESIIDSLSDIESKYITKIKEKLQALWKITQ